MAQNIDFDKYLAAAGFGESVSLGKRSRRVKPKAPNPVAYAESYAFIRNDATRMELEKLRMHVKVARIKASGEGLEDIKNKVVDTVKSGASKVKKTLIELYEKAIRFFTETVRYFFSNEKKLGKFLATLKAAAKKTAKEDKKEISVINTKLEGKLTIEAQGDVAEEFYTLMSKGETEFKDVEEVNDKTSSEIEKLKTAFAEISETVKNKTASDAKIKFENYKGAYDALKAGIDDLISGVEDLRDTGEGLGVMKTLNKVIRELQRKLKDLKKSFKEEKDKDEEATKKYQIQRACINNSVKYTNVVKGLTDKSIGDLIKYGTVILADFNKVSK